MPVSLSRAAFWPVHSHLTRERTRFAPDAVSFVGFITTSAQLLPSPHAYTVQYRGFVPPPHTIYFTATTELMQRGVTSSSSIDVVGLVGGAGSERATAQHPSFTGSADELSSFAASTNKMKRVSSMPVISDKSAGPEPGSQEMRDAFFVKQDAVNFNASYGTPVREVRTLAS